VSTEIRTASLLEADVSIDLGIISKHTSSEEHK
jgi:hypothetical protein